MAYRFCCLGIIDLNDSACAADAGSHTRYLENGGVGTWRLAKSGSWKLFEHGDDILTRHVFAADGAVSFPVACGQRFLLLRFFGMVVIACLLCRP